MYLDVTCPQCKETTPVPTRLAGKALKCPRCKYDLREEVKKAYEARPAEAAGPGLRTWLVVGGLSVVLIVLFVSQLGRLARSSEDEISKAEWLNFTGGQGLFSVQLPGTPEIEKARFPSPVGSLSYRAHTLAVQDYRFSVGVATMPANKPVAGTVDEILDGVVPKMLTELDATRISVRRIASQGHSGVEVIFKLNSEARVGVMRLYLVGRSFIILHARGPGLDPTAPGLRKFINSVELSK